MVEPESFFRPSRFMRWTLVPVLVAFAIWLPLGRGEWNTTRVGVVSALCLLYASTLLWPQRAAWAARATAAGVFLCFVAYLLHEWLFTDEPFRPDERRSDSTPGNALKGLIVIGLPALLFAVRRRRRAGPDLGASRGSVHGPPVAAGASGPRRSLPN